MMKKTILALAALAAFFVSAPAIAGDWAEYDVVGIRTDNTKNPNQIFLNTYSGAGLSQFPEGQWNTVSLPSGLPSDIGAIELAGLLIITHGSTAELCDMHVTFRNVGDTLSPSNYQGQVIEPHLGGGQRSGSTLKVPVTNNQFEFFWERTSPGNYPAYCAYTINYSLQAYYRDVVRIYDPGS